MLTNAYLAGLHSATNEMIQSLGDFEQVYVITTPPGQGQVAFPRLRRRVNKIDNTSFCANYALARLCPGVYTDGFYSQGGNANISLNATHIDASRENTYLYPNGEVINVHGPVLVVTEVTMNEVAVNRLRVIHRDEIQRIFP